MESEGNSKADVDVILKTIYETHSSIIGAGDTEGWLPEFLK